ncbi:MAG: glycosyltransferase [bacterium]|nr:glycosyltransferase [bacterium]
MKKICIDARFWGVTHTGIGRYVENLIANLPQDTDTQVILIINPNQLHEPKLAGYEKHVARAHPYSAWSQIEMLLLLIRIRPDLLHVPHFTIPLLWPGKMVVTIHDLIKHFSRGQETTTHNPLLYWVKYLGYLVVVKLAVMRASHIITPAQYWKDILVAKYHLRPTKESVIYEGVGSIFSE